jgi:hypothetical protein
MNEPVYINEFKKPVYAVNNLHIKKVDNSQTLYELQLNGEYYQIDEKQMEVISQIRYLDGNVGISMG